LTSRNALAQFIIDVAEGLTSECQEVGSKRALKYGDNSWQWRWTFWQERFWDAVGFAALTKL